MTYCIGLEYKEKPDYQKLLKLVEDVAKRERIDLHDKCFDWNILKASQYLYSDPVKMKDMSPDRVKSYTVPSQADCSVLMINPTIMKLAKQQYFCDYNEVM